MFFKKTIPPQKNLNTLDMTKNTLKPLHKNLF